MPATTDPRNGIKNSAPTGEGGWDIWMNANLKYIDNVGMHLSVLTRGLLTPPGSPSNGDTFIMPATGTLTGAWSAYSHGDIAMWSDDDTAYRRYVPRFGFRAVIEDEEVLSVFTVAWSAGSRLSKNRKADSIASASGVVTIDLQALDHFVLPLTENVTSWVFNGLPPAGEIRDITLDTVQHASSAKTVVTPASAGRSAGTWVQSVVVGAVERLSLSVDDAGVVTLVHFTGILS